MKYLLFLVCLFAFSSLHAADDPRTARLAALDDQRVAAMIGADRARLDSLLSAELHYAHSTGVVDTKASLTDTLLGGKIKYESVSYEKRDFTFPAPRVALMTGRVRIKASTATGVMDSVLSYLAVWREEDGQWKFLAWQSCKLPPAEAASK